MSGIDSYNLKKRKRYRFVARHNLIEDDNLPHYYEAKYDGFNLAI